MEKWKIYIEGARVDPPGITVATTFYIPLSINISCNMLSPDCLLLELLKIALENNIFPFRGEGYAKG